ncbi:MAG: Crp/Fnr family transcriptional regulator [Pyrinomonadaceae bacterium]
MFAQITHTNERQDLQIQHTCGDCGLRTENFFCQLPEPELARFEALKVTKAYPKGTLLFIEGQRPAGIYMLCQGQVKLSTCSSDGKIIILGIAGPGDVLGLSAVIADVECEVTAEVLEICQVNFVPKDAFLNLIKEDPAVCLSAVRQLGSSYQTAHKMICSLGLSESVFVKLGKLLLSWGPPSVNGNGHASVHVPFTHEEIAEMIGTTRETVTRSLRLMRERGLVTLRASEMVIHDHDGLRSSVGLSQRH